MVRARTGRVVMSQRDIRQTMQLKPPNNHQHLPPSEFPSLPPTLLCNWCRVNGTQYACLAESSHPSCLQAQCLVPGHHCGNLSREGWVPASGPCCEDCLEAAFDRRRGEGEEAEGGWGRGEGVVRGWTQKGWKAVCGWLRRAQQRWKANSGWGQGAQGRWGEGVSWEAEGFVEVKVVVSREGVMQYLEIDFPTEVPLRHLKAELATLINIPAEEQQWFFQTQPMDESKNLDELKVDIGSILEVKCRT